MNADVTARSIIRHGVALVLLGLLTGVAIPLMTNPRLGLSAHLGGVQNGMLLALLGLAWAHLRLAGGLASATYWLALYSMYVLWIGNLLGAVLGTSRNTPIAGAGYTGTPAAEAVVAFALYSGSIAVVAAVALALWGLRGNETSSR